MTSRGLINLQSQSNIALPDSADVVELIVKLEAIR